MRYRTKTLFVSLLIALSVGWLTGCRSNSYVLHSVPGKCSPVFTEWGSADISFASNLRIAMDKPLFYFRVSSGSRSTNWLTGVKSESGKTLIPADYNGYHGHQDGIFAWRWERTQYSETAGYDVGVESEGIRVHSYDLKSGRMLREWKHVPAPLGGLSVFIRSDKGVMLYLESEGLFNPRGELVFESRGRNIDDISFKHKIFITKEKGVYSFDGKVIVPPGRYSFIVFRGEESENVFFLVQTGWGRFSRENLLDASGRAVLKRDYLFVRHSSRANVIQVCIAPAKCGYIDFSGKILIPFRYDYLYRVIGTEYEIASTGTGIYDPDKGNVLIDRRGNKILPLHYHYLQQIGPGILSAGIREENNENNDHKIQAPQRISLVTSIDGYTKQEYSHSLIDYKGNFLLPPGFMIFDASGFLHYDRYIPGKVFSHGKWEKGYLDVKDCLEIAKE